MIHNLYTDTIDNIKATEDFKQKLIENLQSQSVVSVAKREKKRFLEKSQKLAFASIFVIVVIAAGVFGGMGIFLNQNKTAGVLPPHFKVNDRVYWTQGNETSKLPASYKPVGKILSYGSDEKLENFQSTFADIGSVIYMDPSNPYAAYLNIRCDDKKSISYLPTDLYQLYVTQELRSGYIYYNGNLYKNTIGATNKLPMDYKCVGTVKSIDYTRIPSHNFESNFFNSLGCNIYASETDKNTIYVEQMQSNNRYLFEFKKQ